MYRSPSWQNRSHPQAMSSASTSPSTSTPPKPRGLPRVLGLRRVLVAFIASAVVGLILSPMFLTMSTARVIGREVFVGLAALLAFGLFEQWPARLPSWIARWALQV